MATAKTYDYSQNTTKELEINIAFNAKIRNVGAPEVQAMIAEVNKRKNTAEANRTARKGGRVTDK